MSTSEKRKSGPQGGGRPLKKSKGGTAGQWQTPAHAAKMAKLGRRGALLEVGDQGIWVTFARGMERRAAEEFSKLCEDLGEKLYGIARPQDGAALAEDDDDDEGLDIEASIKKELEGYKAPAEDRQVDKAKKAFIKVRVDIDCVFFVKTRSPVQPVELCRRICEDAKACLNPMERKTKYINRLTPVTAMDKASEKGIERAARQALSQWFKLKNTDGTEDATADSDAEPVKNAYSYAIRHSIRNNTEIKHDDLIKQIASLVHSQHKVDLGKPDKVILVDIFQSFSAVGVIEGSDWSDLRKLNVNELYKLSTTASEGDSKPVPKQ
ncbi:THUMP domain-containing protein [Plectosphaerella cucumerina]|uniref:THUMP domain-containing protein n=1 Tax=Plectosphaerella cucumerina TaxID=40658 RepID=A0A8K0X8U1_9PEZI|nr:THUMP domain-containing protein [Plectosphaerella cucumerina]